MKSKLITFVIGVITLCAVIVCVITFTHAAIRPIAEPEMPVVITPAPVSTSTEGSIISSSTSTPDQLIIPSIQVNAHVQHVGISKHGTMAVPTNYTDVGWYRYGVIPGQQGSAVFAGHLDNGFGLAGVFNKLKNLQEGDDIYVTLADSTHLHFKVSGIDRYDQTTSDTSEIFSSEGNPRIKLITCDGEWDAKSLSYSQRYIVTAELVND